MPCGRFGGGGGGGGHVPLLPPLGPALILFYNPGICKFAVDLFIEPSKKKITVPKTRNTKLKRENSQHKTQKSKHRSHKLWTKNTKHLYTKHNVTDRLSLYILCFVCRCFEFCVHYL